MIITSEDKLRITLIDAYSQDGYYLRYMTSALQEIKVISDCEKERGMKISFGSDITHLTINIEITYDSYR